MSLWTRSWRSSRGWICFRRRFVADFVRAVGASAELGRWSVLAQVLVEWKATAAIHADPALVEELTQSLDEDLGPVPPPDGS
jgi:hypothetical protein